MLSEKFGHALDRPLKSFAKRIPLSPNVISITGFTLTVVSSFVLAQSLTLGAFCLLPAALLDMLDGIVARSKGESSSFGAFLDSVLDRYSDSVILLAIAWNLGSVGHMTGVFLALSTLIGSLIISYARARAEGLGVSCSHGLMERPERLILLFIGAVSGYMVMILWVLAGLTHFTVLQRILYAKKQFKSAA
ncbi:MAG: CDP-alcohol phosphatidyltransferase family protein [Nitrospirae bacterium]|nr:CDP-alcohol phosphatidyltransferase family protein [Nitrospirota bacterium]